MSYPASPRRSDARKQTVYLPRPLLERVTQQMKRHERSLSWIVQVCVEAKLSDLERAPGVMTEAEAFARRAFADRRISQ